METLIKSFIGGLWIAIAVQVSLSAPTAIAPFIFSIGLLSILYGNYYLFTGKVGSKIEFNKIWVVLSGNFLGVIFCPFIENLTKFERLAAIVDQKNSMVVDQIFVSSLLCGFLMYFATQKANKNPILIILAVSSFIIGGFDHSVANMGYWAYSHLISYSGPQLQLKSVLVSLVGNLIGSQFLYLCERGFKSGNKMFDFIQE